MHLKILLFAITPQMFASDTKSWDKPVKRLNLCLQKWMFQKTLY